jgi:hypothetical protein
VSKATFSAVDNHAWHRLMRWIRDKYAGKTGLSMKQMRRRFGDVGWRFAHNGVVFTGASSVTVTRYRYRGGNIPDPETAGRTKRLTSGQGTWSARCGESRTPGAAGGSRETDGGDTGTAPAVLPDQTCRRELLDRTLIWNQRHLLHALREFEVFYNEHRPHQGIANARPVRRLPPPITDPDQIADLEIRRHQRLGGILHGYKHAA